MIVNKNARRISEKIKVIAAFCVKLKAQAAGEYSAELTGNFSRLNRRISWSAGERFFLQELITGWCMGR
jgi:hypothetical protein